MDERLAEQEEANEGDKAFCLASGWSALPAEVLVLVVSHLSPPDAARAEAVCRAWRAVIDCDEPTWRTIHRNHLGGPLPPRRMHPNNILFFLIKNRN